VNTARSAIRLGGQCWFVPREGGGNARLRAHLGNEIQNLGASLNHIVCLMQQLGRLPFSCWAGGRMACLEAPCWSSFRHLAGGLLPVLPLLVVMATPHHTAFENFFETLVISRVNYKALAHYTLLTAQQAGLPASFTPTLTSLAAHYDAFDANLTDRLDPTAGATEAFKRARKAWLTFVDDTMKDLVTPKLRKAAAYADFKKFGKSKLSLMQQDELLTESKALLALYVDHAAALGAPTLAADALAAYDALRATDAIRDTQAATLDTARLALAGDRAAIATDLFAVKCLLHLHYPHDADKVYSFFDFSKVRVSGGKKPKKPPIF
jgi:hypothetical protein